MEGCSLHSLPLHLRGPAKLRESPHVLKKCHTRAWLNEGRSVWHFLYRNMQHESLTINFSRKMHGNAENRPIFGRICSRQIAQETSLSLIRRIHINGGLCLKV